MATRQVQGGKSRGDGQRAKNLTENAIRATYIKLDNKNKDIERDRDRESKKKLRQYRTNYIKKGIL
jgi:hypothetical protein